MQLLYWLKVIREMSIEKLFQCGPLGPNLFLLKHVIHSYCGKCLKTCRQNQGTQSWWNDELTLIMMVIFRGRSKYASFSGRDWKEKQQNPVSLLAAVSRRQRAESAGTLWLPQPRQLQPGSAASPGHEDLSWRSDFQIQLHRPTWACWKEVKKKKKIKKNHQRPFCWIWMC